MKKLVIVICLVLILSLSFVSAGLFSDFWGRITGHVVEEDCSDGLDGDEDGLTDCDDDDCAYTVTCIHCTDSDGGMDYYISGVATGIYAGGISSKHFIYGDGDVQVLDGPGESIYYDYCGNDVQLNEAFCGTDGRLNAMANMCSNGCEDGACIAQVCPSIIGWRIENNKCISDSGCDYDSTEYTYYNSIEECEKQLEPVITECGENIGCLSEEAMYCEGSNACISITEYNCIDG